MLDAVAEQREFGFERVRDVIALRKQHVGGEREALQVELAVGGHGFVGHNGSLRLQSRELGPDDLRKAVRVAGLSTGSEWRKSSYSDSTGGNCVEVSVPGDMLVRDTTDRNGPALAFRAGPWRQFLDTLR